MMLQIQLLKYSCLRSLIQESNGRRDVKITVQQSAQCTVVVTGAKGVSGFERENCHVRYF